MADFECKSRAMALSALDTIAANMKGPQRAAVLAIKSWTEANVPLEQTQDEIKERLRKIFEEKTPGEQKGWDWYCRGSRKEGGELVSAEPEDGAEWKCVWNAKRKRWEPPYPPPLIVKKGEAAQNPPEAQ